MTSALVQNDQVLEFYPADLPGQISHNGKTIFIGAQIGASSADGYSILPATYTDTPPQATSYSTGNSYTISNGTVQVTRTWVTPAQPVPATITNAQARQWLAGAGLLDQVSAALTTLGGNNLIKWEYANTIARNDPLVARLAAQLGKTSADMDAMFIAGGAL